MDSLNGLFSGTFQSILVAILVWLATISYKGLINNFRQRKPLMKIYRMNNKKDLSIIIPTILNNELTIKEHVTYSTTIEPIRILRDVIENIDKINKNIKINYQFSEEVNKELLQNNLLLVGGPINNKITKKFYSKLDKLPFWFDGHDLKVKKSDGEINTYSVKKSIIDGYEVVDEDYVAIIITKNPWNEESNILHFAGCWAYGSIGAVRFLNEKNILNNEKLNQMNSEDSYIIICKMDIEHFGKNIESDIVDIKLLYMEKF